MAFVDMTLKKLRDYLPARPEPTDFDAFWAATLAEARTHPLAARFEPVESRLSTVEVEDVTFSGFGGQAVKGWLTRPANAAGPLPTVVEFVGYGGGRGLPHERLVWASAGYAHLTMDTRGQGSAWQVGDTPDDGPSGNSHPGFATRGVLDRDTYYYRRLYTDAVRALEAARTHPSVDPARVLVAGGSQGGGIAIAAAGLVGDLAGVVTDVPFMQHIRHATEITDGYPYKEIAEFCKVHRDKVERVFDTISYVDGVNFAARANAPALYSVALMDDVCPPSTVFASFNHYAGPKEIEVYPYNGHEGGGAHHVARALEFAQSVVG
ncbi:Acetyl xylan esterase [Catenulispora acidiphila DSM 44928]|uniref:Acetyl xylan esterase n=1 Tax=Catenulispora acidiphila (strain DSM 44928 / JCM 14897 / NBRC 102108 / NRRL B-24433 / ID139908) TaxID=479433 RepID=C7PZN0_CATAD|nr:acetylxylan esterase [Catenulispora acidiphila]ACU73545.1 Acetyl xylan esterase [Catenulispora acidiphila DSM 44928]